MDAQEAAVSAADLEERIEYIKAAIEQDERNGFNDMANDHKEKLAIMEEELLQLYSYLPYKLCNQAG